MAESKKQAFVDRLAGRRRNAGRVPHEIESRVPRPLPVESVAAVLRRTREEQGRDLVRVAGDLKIRRVYLAAIEEGRFDDLPGATYAVGFVRAYADYLRLDSEEIIRRFREEVEGLDEHLQLVFPTPSPESKIPGRALLLISVLLVALAYGGWHTLSSERVNLADWVPKVPERLRSLTSLGSSETPPEAPPGMPNPVDGLAAGGAEAEVAEGAPPEVEPALLPGFLASPEMTALPVASEEATDSPPVEEAVEEAGEEAVAAAAPEIGEPAPPALESASEAETGTLAPPSPDAAPAETALAEAAPPEAAAATAAPAEAAAQPATTGLVATELAATEIPQAPLPDGPLPEARAREPRVFGAENVSARIVLRAVFDSWVQVRDAEDSLLLTRVLQPGDTYRVPNQPGLTLLTGNAGGLQIDIDGATLPPLGPVGSVRRNIPLNPDRMVDGAANSR